VTIPWLMNCAHSADGWCLECVVKMGEERLALECFAQEVALGAYQEHELRAVALKVLMRSGLARSSGERSGASDGPLNTPHTRGRRIVRWI
jgi:hypothetical protein